MKFRQSAKILTSFFILIISYNSVFPHSCATFKYLSDKEHAEKLDSYSAIFLGEVISTQRVDMYVQIIEMKVLKSWKGIEKAKVSVKFTNSGCYENDFSFSNGKQLMIYGGLINNGELIDVNCCNFSLFDDERMKKFYGEGKVIEQPQPSPSPTETTEGFWSSLWKKIKSFFS